MKILICGDRNWKDVMFIRSYILSLDPETVIINGGAKGVDIIADYEARKFGFDVIKIKAEWDKYGRSAGPIRNRKMLDMKPDLVVAFHNDIDNSKGTKDCITEAKRRNIPVEIYP